MKSFNALQISPSLYNQLQAAKSSFYKNENNTLLQFKPPKSNMGLAEEKDLFETFHLYESEDTPFKHINKSPVCGYEIWIEPDSIDFTFYTSDTETDTHYRKQLITHYNGCELEPRDKEFIETEQGNYASAIRFQLNHHYFEPVKTKKSSDGFINNPYKSIFGELTLDRGMNAIIQFMFKPAEKDWTALNNKDVEDHAEDVLERSKYKSSLFGLRTKKKDSAPSNIKSEAKKIRNQEGQKGFYMDIRIALVGPNKKDVEDQMKQIINLYDKYFTSPSGQSLHPYGYKDPKKQEKILLDMIQRNPQYMRQPKHPKSFIHEEYINDNFDTLIMSIDELTALAPIPFEKEFHMIDQIKWADKPLSGTVTGISEEWTPLTEEERQEQVQRLVGGEEEGSDPRVRIPDQDQEDVDESLGDDISIDDEFETLEPDNGDEEDTSADESSESTEESMEDPQDTTESKTEDKEKSVEETVDDIDDILDG